MTNWFKWKIEKTGETEKFYWHGRMGYVHIDDVASSHILVYEKDEAKGRYLCSSKVVDNDELASILSARYPTLPVPKRLLPLFLIIWLFKQNLLSHNICHSRIPINFIFKHVFSPIFDYFIFFILYFWSLQVWENW